jgi:signal transduction histidine kinase/ActR/RegA family two-component response regulator
MITFLQKKLSDISISKKLYFTIAIMALLITIELCTLFFAITTLSSVRSYVEGEGLWSKAQKDAVLNLRIYAYSHNEKDYAAFQQFMKVPLGDRKSRKELLKRVPDMAVARQGLIEGRNHPDDVGGMLKLIIRFHNISYLKRAFTAWTNAEFEVTQLLPISAKLHTLVQNNAPQTDINALLDQINDINKRVTVSEDQFSYILGEGARWLESIVLKLLLGLSLTIGTTSIIVTVSVSRNIQRSIKAINDGAAQISQGVLSARVKVYSKDEIGMLATSFNRMTDTLEHNIQDLMDTEEKLKEEKKKAESSEKVKQLFLANMSHEIRTPMNAILGFTRLLQDSSIDEEQRKYIEIILQSGDNLLVIINDILDFSKIEAGKVVFEVMPFHLVDSINSIIDLQSAKAGQKNIKLTSHIDENLPVMVQGDAVRLNQIMLNLISNAIKFTEQGEVNISVTAIKQTDNDVVIGFAVKDTGIGIPIEKQEKIFEIFEQATTSTVRKFGGTGLGLSIVKQLVELQGGKITVKSQPGEGSEFSFRLRFLKQSAEDTLTGLPSPVIAKPAELTKAGAGKRILVAEDNPINSLLVIKVLKRQGYETDVAENGKIALEKHLSNKYDMILMDLQMPEMDGYEATMKIRRSETDNNNIPIIAMTAHTIKGEYERCMEIGMNNFISKPFRPDDLYEKIDTLLKSA